MTALWRYCITMAYICPGFSACVIMETIVVSLRPGACPEFLGIMANAYDLLAVDLRIYSAVVFKPTNAN